MLMKKRLLNEIIIPYVTKEVERLGLEKDQVIP